MKKIVVDYKNSLVSVSNSILKYFEVQPFHETMKELDEILENKKYKNVVLLILDGLGSYNLTEMLKRNAFLKEHKLKDISTVFPPTTTAATTSILTGLTPSEHNWYGWDMYFKDTDETISLYLDKLKDSHNKPKLSVKKRKYMQFKSIVDLINETKKAKAYYAYPFDTKNPCHDIDEVLARITKLCKTKDKKFIYSYIEKPDKLFHELGVHSLKVVKEMEEINQKIEEATSKLKDTLVIISADHGLVKTKYINIQKDIPKLYDMLARTTAIEPRAAAIKLKDDVKKEEFEELFNKYLKNAFCLLTKDEVLDLQLFGPQRNQYLEDTLGDYLIVATRNYCLNYDDNSPIFKANHAGFTKKEMLVPLIIIDRK